MPALTLPIGTVKAAATAYSRDAMVGLLKELSDTAFTGYLAITSGDRLFLLFIFQGTPYSAGLAVGEKPTPLTITNFSAQIATICDGSGTISLHETDPVLLKCMLVFIQDEPAAKGPVNLINLDGMVNQIKTNEADALVILEKDGCCNFFFFLDGTKTAAYWSDGLTEAPDGLSVDEQMLLYAYQETTIPVTATIYQTLNTMKSKDSSNISLEALVRLFAAVEDTEQTIAPGKLSVQHHDQLRLKVQEGPQAGADLGGSLPCVLGRKEADIIINDPMVSKRHAAIQVINGKLMLIDLHSTNGTTLNNEPITQRELKQGDRIGVGQTVLLVTTLNPS
ncbi:MAG: FHA domain-containing protein [Geobacteraceae bacterium]|nr:FHA domain-containing protein [Geobacteraceae bacterium]